MNPLLLLLLLLSIATENLTELIVKDEVTEKFRLFFFEEERRPKILFEFLQGLLSCGRCFSGWVSFMFTLGIVFSYPLSLGAILVIWMVIWYGSNISHHIRDRINPNYKEDS